MPAAISLRALLRPALRWAIGVTIAGCVLAAGSVALGAGLSATEIAISRVAANWKTELILLDVGRILGARWAVPGQAMDAHWSPDGSKLVLAQFVPPPPWPSDVVYVWEDGRISSPRRLQLSDFRWAPRPVDFRGRQYAMALALSTSANSDIYLADADGQNRRKLFESRGEEYAPRWSPDSRYLLYTAILGEFATPFVRLIDFETGSRRLLSAIGSNFPISEVDWSPDGLRAAYSAIVDDALKIVVQEMRTGEERALLPDRPGDQQTPRWSPDGETLAVRINGRLHLVSGDGTGLYQVNVPGAAARQGVWAGGLLIVSASDSATRQDDKIALFALDVMRREVAPRPLLRDKFYYPPLARPGS
jgi:hypothetical protein